MDCIAPSTLSDISRKDASRLVGVIANGSSATLGTTSVFKGTIMALTSITAETGASIEGRLLARNGAVTLDGNPVACAV